MESELALPWNNNGLPFPLKHLPAMQETWVPSLGWKDLNSCSCKHWFFSKGWRFIFKLFDLGQVASPLGASCLYWQISHCTNTNFIWFLCAQCNNANKVHLNIKIHVTLKILNKHNYIYLNNNVSFIKKKSKIFELLKKVETNYMQHSSILS